MNDGSPENHSKVQRTADFLVRHGVAPAGVAESYAQLRSVQLLCEDDFEYQLGSNLSCLGYWLEPEVLGERPIRTGADGEAYLYLALDEMLSEWREGAWSEPMSCWLWFKDAMDSRPALTFDQFVSAVRQGVRESLRERWDGTERAEVPDLQDWAFRLPRVHQFVVKAALAEIRTEAHFEFSIGGHAKVLSHKVAGASANGFSAENLEKRLLAPQSDFSLRKSTARFHVEVTGELIVSPSGAVRTIRGRSVASALEVARTDFEKSQAVMELLRAGLVADRTRRGSLGLVRLEPGSLRSILVRALECAIVEQPKGSAWARIAASIDFAVAALAAPDPRHRLVGAVTALEALFLREREGVRRSLSDRIAVFVERREAHRVAARKWIGNLYRNRSDIVHGRRIPPSVRRWQLSQLLGGCIVQSIQFVALREAAEDTSLTGLQFDESLELGVRTRRRRSELLPLDIGKGLWRNQPHDVEGFLDQRE